MRLVSKDFFSTNIKTCLDFDTFRLDDSVRTNNCRLQRRAELQALYPGRGADRSSRTGYLLFVSINDDYKYRTHVFGYAPIRKISCVSCAVLAKAKSRICHFLHRHAECPDLYCHWQSYYSLLFNSNLNTSNG